MVRNFGTLQLVLVIIFDMFLSEVTSIFTHWALLRISVLNMQSQTRWQYNRLIQLFVLKPVLSLIFKIADFKILLWCVIIMSFEDTKKIPLTYVWKKSIINSWSFHEAVAFYGTQVDRIHVVYCIITSARLWTHSCNMISKSYAVDRKWPFSIPVYMDVHDKPILTLLTVYKS